MDQLVPGQRLMKFSACAPLFAIVLMLSATAQMPPKKPGSPVKAAPSATDNGKPKFKAIWEPVNYPQDAELTSVYFTNADVGWVTGLKRTDAGEGGFIIHTTDGGEHWNLQMGDPLSGTRSITNMFFQNPTHGWAGQFGGQLLRTTDGENWESAGKFETLNPYAFISPAVGFATHTSELRRTDDAGKSWKVIFTCQASVEVQGLRRDQRCDFISLHFPTPQVGFAASSKLADGTSAVFKTSNGGESWALISFLSSDALHRTIGFANADTGFIKTSAGLMGTFDGGKTWKGIPVSMPGNNPIHFAQQVGWFVENNTFAYTGNGGKRWNSVDLRLPARVNDFSLPRPDRGYVVGEHGMVYRYRVVPIEYTGKGMIPAPAM